MKNKTEIEMHKKLDREFIKAWGQTPHKTLYILTKDNEIIPIPPHLSDKLARFVAEEVLADCMSKG